MRNVRGTLAPAIFVSPVADAGGVRLQILGSLDDLGDEVLADADQRRVLGEVASIDGRALRLDQIAFDLVAGEVVDLGLGRAALIGGSRLFVLRQRAGSEAGEQSGADGERA